MRWVGRNESANLSSEIFFLLDRADSGVDVAFLLGLGRGGDVEELLDLPDGVGSFPAGKPEGLDAALTFPVSQTCRRSSISIAEPFGCFVDITRHRCDKLAGPWLEGYINV